MFTPFDFLFDSFIIHPLIKMTRVVESFSLVDNKILPNLRSRWRHQIETFSALLAIYEGNPPVTGGFRS